MTNNTKERVAFLKSEARRILDESGADITGRVAILPLAKQLMAATGCGIDAAKRRIVEAIRRKRGEHVKAGGWGGKREGAGRPPAKHEEAAEPVDKPYANRKVK